MATNSAEVVRVEARALAPNTPSGALGAYGIWHADAHLSNGDKVWGRGLSEQEARDHALLRVKIHAQ